MRWPRLENDTEKWQTILDNYPCRKAAVANYKLVTTLHCCVPLPLPPPLANISTKLAKIVPSFYTESPVPSYRLRFNPVPSHPTRLCVLQPKCLCQSIVVFISAGLVPSAASPPPILPPPPDCLDVWNLFLQHSRPRLRPAAGCCPEQAAAHHSQNVEFAIVAAVTNNSAPWTRAPWIQPQPLLAPSYQLYNQGEGPC